MTKTLPLQTHVHFSLASQENRKGTPTSSEKFKDLKKKKNSSCVNFFMPKHFVPRRDKGSPKPNMIPEQAVNCVAPAARDTRKIR